MAFGLSRLPDTILFGPGQLGALGSIASTLGSRALICTDARMAALPIMDDIRANLQDCGVEVRIFSDTQAELPVSNIESCVATYTQFDPDVIVGLGGGSCMDLAKLVSLLFTHGGPVSQFYGEMKVPSVCRPVIAIPTTSGTGSEVTPVAVLGDDERELKIGVSSPFLIPAVAICDPELTVSCPAALTALSGADAYAHALEAISATQREPVPDLSTSRVFVGKNILSDLYAKEALQLIFNNLPIAVEKPDDLQARSAMMMGSTLAGLAFSTAGTSAAHAIQYPIGAISDSAHGLGIGTLLPHVMRFNRDAALPVYSMLAKALGVADGQQTDVQAADALIDATKQLFARIGIPADLRELGVEPSDAEWIAERSLLSARLAQNNPRPLDHQGVLQILSFAWGKTT